MAKQLSESTGKIEILEAMLVEANDRVNKHEHHAERRLALETKLEEVNGQFAELQDAYSQLKKSNKQSEENHEMVSNELASLRIRNNELRKDLEASTKASESLYSEHLSEIEALEIKLAASQKNSARIPLLEKELGDVKSQLVVVEQFTKQLKEAHAASLTELQSAYEKSKGSKALK